MKRPATWKILTLGVAVTGLGFMGGAGTALADSGATAVQPLRVSGADPSVIPLDPPWWDDDMVDWLDELPVPDVPIHHIPDGPFWDDDWFDD